MTTVTPNAGAAERPWWLFAAFVGAYALAGAAGLDAQHLWGDDWAQYVLHARNLVTGHPYADTGYVFNPDFAWAGPPSYPPGTPAVLAPAMAAFGFDVVALKVPGLVCLALALPFAVRLLAPAIGLVPAMVGVAIVALHPGYFALRQFVQSEAPYMLFSLWALWWAQRPAREDARGAFAQGLVLGLLLFAAIMSRAVGVALVPAVLVHAWARGMRWTWLAGAAIAFLVPLGLQWSLLAPPPTYEAELQAPTVARVAGQPFGYFAALLQLFPAPFGLARVLAPLVLVGVAAGAWLVVARSPRPAGAGRLRALAARVPVYLWYLGAYLSALFLASVGPNHRLLLPVLPIVIPLAVHAAHRLLARLPQARVLVPAAALAALAYVLALDLTGRGDPRGQQATCAECREMFDFIRRETPRESVIVFAKPRAMALLGERRSWAPSPRYTREQFERRAARLGADYVVDGAPGSEFAARFPLSHGMHESMGGAGAEVVFRNRQFVVVRLKPAPRAS